MAACRPRRGKLSGRVAMVAVAAIVGAGCAPGADSVEDAAAQMLHVHALQADPLGDGVLLAATHTGLFRIDGDTIERVSAKWHDLMAFTIGPDEVLLASGHPAMDASHLRLPDHPPHLGLVRSTDAGRSWHSVSLLGEADFHALVVSGDMLFGAESTTGQLLVSTDAGKTWQTRSRIDLFALAAHPTHTGLLVGASADGLVRSEDAGQTWVVSANMAGPVAANTDGFVVAMPDGQVAMSADGSVWQPVGQLPSSPQALLAVEDRLYAWTKSDGLKHSDDGGYTWQANAGSDR